MATATERKFTSLRKRLDQMGYRQPLSIEALPLTEKLFGDLMHTTESLKNAKQHLGKQKEEKVVWEQHVEPYKDDNARIIKENNKLNQKIMKMKESSERRIRDIETKMRRTEHENTDIKFLNTQYLQRLRAQEKDLDRMTEKMVELQEKNLQAVIQTPGGKKKHIPFRRQRMEIDCVLPESDGRGSVPMAPMPDPYVADLLHVADERMAGLQEAVRAGEKDKERLQESLEALRRQVDNREAEIERLNSMLKGGRPAEALAAEGIRLSNERMVAHLNVQVDFLQQTAKDLEGKLAGSETSRKQLEEKAGELGNKNAKICFELEEIGQLVKQMEKEREDSEAALKMRIKELESVKLQLLDTRGEVEGVLCGMEGEKADLLHDNQRMAKLLAGSEGDRKDTASLLDRVIVERKDFQRQCKRFKEKEEILHTRISQLESQVATIRSSSLRPHPPQAASEIRMLRKEKNDLKEAIRGIETELLQIQMDTKTLAEDRDNFKLLYEQVREELSWAKEQLRSSPGSGVGVAVMRRIEGERDHALLELKQLRSENGSLQERVRMLQSMQQRDLSSLEESLAEVHAERDKVCEERDSLARRLQSSQDLLASLRKELDAATKDLATANTEIGSLQSKVGQLQALVEASEKTRQALTKELREKDGSVERTNASASTLNARIVKLECEVKVKDSKLTELSHSLGMLDQARDKLVAEANSKDELVAELRRSMEDRKTELDRDKSRASQLEKEVSRTKEAVREKDREIGKLEARLADTRRQLQDSRDQALTLSTQIRELRDDLEAMTQESRTAHLELEQLARERTSQELKCEELGRRLDQLQEAARAGEQEKAEAIQSCHALAQQVDRLEAEVNRVQNDHVHAQQDMHVLHQEKQRLDDVLEGRDREIKSLRSYEQQLSAMSHALSKLEAALRQEQEEKKALLTDLEVTRDLCLQLEKSKESLTVQLSTQNIHYEQVQCQLGELKAECDLYRSKLEAKRMQVEQLQSLLAAERKKEFVSHMTSKEREEELRHVRQLMSNLEADRLALADQARRLRANTVVQNEALGRLKSELMSEKFQKEHVKKQLETQRTSLTLLTSSRLQASTRSPSPPPHVSPRPNSPHPVLPQEPLITSPHSTPPLSQQPADSMEDSALLSRERHTFETKSSVVVEKLLKSKPSSLPAPSSFPTSPHPLSVSQSPASTP